jgi:hypothetical protein
MRKIATLSVLLAIGFVVIVTEAQTPPPPPSPAPGAFARAAAERLLRGPQIASAKKQGSAAYAGDSALAFEVEISNDSATALNTQLVVTQMIPTERATPAEGARVASVPVQIAARGRVTVTYSNPKGLTDGCNPSYHRLALENTATATTYLRIKPTCAFGATIRNPETGLAADRIASRHNNHISYHSAGMVKPVPECNLYIVTEATIENQTTSNATNVYLEVLGPDGERYPTPNAIPRYTLAPGASRPGTRGLGPKFVGQAGRWTFKVGADGDPDRLYQVNVGADITRLCSIKTELTNVVTPLPSPPPQRGE